MTAAAVNEGFPALSGARPDSRMSAVTSLPLYAPPAGARRTAVVELVGAAWLSTTVAAVLNGPVMRSEPVFASINVATTATLVTLGVYLMRAQSTRFTGWCFVLAGVSWLLTVTDTLAPAWGPLVHWVLSGVTYVALGWAILRYRRPRLAGRAERWFVIGSAVGTVGVAVVTTPFLPPEVLGYPAHTLWPPLLIDSVAAIAVALALNCAAFAALAVAFCALMVRILREAPVVSRHFLRPMLLFGGILAAGSALVQVAAMVDPVRISLHHAAATVGALILCLSAALALTMLLQHSVGSRFVANLPPVRTPETVSAYLRTVLEDPSAELWYWSAENSALLDEHGTPRGSDSLPAPEQRFSAWIHDSDGARVALLVADPCLGRDPAALDTLARVLSIVAENARLNVLLRMRVTELNATRTAEKMAFENAREQFHRNLHDGLQQTIASVRMDLDGLHDVMDSAEGHAVVSDLEDKLALALDQVHSLKRGADPPELRFGLKPAIERTIAELRLDARCQVSTVDLGVLTLPIYYLVRESLTNVHKHARAGWIEVEVSTDRRSIEVLVRDDGVGGAAESDRGGIAGMRRRAEELGGRLDVITAPGAGTVICASLPFVAA